MLKKGDISFLRFYVLMKINLQKHCNKDTIYRCTKKNNRILQFYKNFITFWHLKNKTINDFIINKTLFQWNPLYLKKFTASQNTLIYINTPFMLLIQFILCYGLWYFPQIYHYKQYTNINTDRFLLNWVSKTSKQNIYECLQG